MGKKIPLWFVFLLIYFAIIGAILFGWVVQHTARGGQNAGVFGEYALSIAKYPSFILKSYKEITKAAYAQWSGCPRCCGG